MVNFPAVDWLYYLPSSLPARQFARSGLRPTTCRAALCVCFNDVIDSASYYFKHPTVSCGSQAQLTVHFGAASNARAFPFPNLAGVCCWFRFASCVWTAVDWFLRRAAALPFRLAFRARGLPPRAHYRVFPTPQLITLIALALAAVHTRRCAGLASRLRFTSVSKPTLFACDAPAVAHYAVALLRVWRLAFCQFLHARMRDWTPSFGRILGDTARPRPVWLALPRAREPSVSCVPPQPPLAWLPSAVHCSFPGSTQLPVGWIAANRAGRWRFLDYAVLRARMRDSWIKHSVRYFIACVAAPDNS